MSENVAHVESHTPSGPQGRALKPLDGIEWYELEKSRVYTVWAESKQTGTVKVLSRATEAPRIYDDRVIIQRPEYEAIVTATQESRKFDDLYAAVRYVGNATVLETARD